MGASRIESHTVSIVDVRCNPTVHCSWRLPLWVHPARRHRRSRGPATDRQIPLWCGVGRFGGRRARHATLPTGPGGGGHRWSRWRFGSRCWPIRSRWWPTDGVRCLGSAVGIALRNLRRWFATRARCFEHIWQSVLRWICVYRFTYGGTADHDAPIAPLRGASHEMGDRHALSSRTDASSGGSRCPCDGDDSDHGRRPGLRWRWWWRWRL